MNIFYQLIGFGALIAMGLSYWQNDKRTILLWQVVSNLIFAIHYTLLHACSGDTHRGSISADCRGDL